MNKQSKIYRIKEVIKHYQEFDKQTTSLVNVLGCVYDSPLYTAINYMIDEIVDLLSEAVGDEEEWIKWFLYDNQAGVNQKNVSLKNGDEFDVCNVDDLIKVMETQYNWGDE